MLPLSYPTHIVKLFKFKHALRDCPFNFISKINLNPLVDKNADFKRIK